MACVFQLSFTAGGTIVPTYKFKVMQMDIYDGVDLDEFEEAFSESFGLKLEAVVIGFVAQMLIKEVINYAKIRWVYGVSGPYFKNIWNLLEIINITPFFFSYWTRLLARW